MEASYLCAWNDPHKIWSQMDNLQTQCRHDEDALPRTMARGSTSWYTTSDALQRKDEKGSATGWNCYDARRKKMEKI